MERLTDRQRQVFDFITQYGDEHGYPPTIGEIMRRFSFASPNAAASHLAALSRKGYIRKTGKISRSIVPTNRPAGLARVPVLGRVPAGRPVLEDENPGETLFFDRRLVPGDRVFALTVRGESMVEAGILDGDYVLVRADAPIAEGDVVVAMLDGEYTVKSLHRRGATIELRPANPAFRPIVVSGQLDIVGKVVAVYRKLP